MESPADPADQCRRSVVDSAVQWCAQRSAAQTTPMQVVWYLLDTTVRTHRAQAPSDPKERSLDRLEKLLALALQVVVATNALVPHVMDAWQMIRPYAKQVLDILDRFYQGKEDMAAADQAHALALALERERAQQLA